MTDIARQYADLDRFNRVAVEDPSAIAADCLLAFAYDYPEDPAEVLIETDEFTAVCPWTGQPDSGSLAIRYLPGEHLLELKSLKYYLLSFRSVGIVQEHAANRILADLARVVQPRWMELRLDYRARGGIHTVVTARYPRATPPPAPPERP